MLYHKSRHVGVGPTLTLTIHSARRQKYHEHGVMEELIMRSLQVGLIVFIALLSVMTGFVITALVYCQMRGETVRGVDRKFTSTSQG